MNLRNVNEKPEKKEDAKEKTDEKSRKTDVVKKLAKHLLVEGAVVAALALPGCMNRIGEKGIDLDGITDTREDNRLDRTGDMGEVSDVPEEIEDVSDVESEDVVSEDAAGEDMVSDVVEEGDVVSDVEEEDVVSDVEEDVEEDVSEDVESEDVVSEDAVSEDVIGEDTGVDSSVDTVDEDVSDIVGEEVIGTCSASDSTRTEVIYLGGSATVGNIDVRYDGPTTSGEGEYSILCDGTVVRSGITVAAGSTETVDITEQSFSVELTPSSVNPFNTMISISVDAY